MPTTQHSAGPRGLAIQRDRGQALRLTVKAPTVIRVFVARRSVSKGAVLVTDAPRELVIIDRDENVRLLNGSTAPAPTRSDFAFAAAQALADDATASIDDRQHHLILLARHCELLALGLAESSDRLPLTTDH